MWQKIRLYWSKTNRWHRLGFILLLVQLKLVPQGHTGFLCNDPSLSHPFTGDTVNWKWLLSVTILLPLPFILAVERKYHNSNGESQSLALTWFKEYLFGFLLNATTVETLKVLVGAPRPHFFNTCSPKEAELCNGSDFISSYTCTKAHWIAQSDRSFPSGHTSLAVHAAVFTAWYLHRRTPRAAHVTATQVTCLLAAVACAGSRLADRRHHVTDVLVGAVIAVGVLGYTIFHLCNNFNPKPVKCNGTTDVPSS